MTPPPRFDLARAVRLFTGPFMVIWAYSWWLITDLRWLAPAMSLLCLAAAIATMAAACGDHQEAFWERFDLWAFGAILAMGIPWLAVEASAHAYASDEVALGQAAANALLHGVNPYAHDLVAWLHQFGLSPRISTPLLDGGSVDGASYPALSFLMYAPLGAIMGQGAQYGQVTDVIAWAAAVALMWRVLPVGVRPLVPILASVSFFVLLVADGTTDCLYLPLLMGALWRWNRYGDPADASAARWIGPVLLGLACAVKQGPWLMAPFLLTGIVLEARGRGRPWPRPALRYAGTAGAAFLLPNLPFLLLSPGSWLRGILVPLTQPLIPFGQGVIQLVSIAGLGGGRLWPFGAAAILGELAALLAFVALWPRTRPALPLLAVAPLALSTRSLPNYFVDVLPPLLIAAATVHGEAPQIPARVRTWTTRGAVAALGLGGAGVVVALASPPPLSVRVTAATTGEDADGAARTTLQVAVTNGSSRPLHPSFVTLTGVEWVPGWRAEAGPQQLAAGATATYRVVSTDHRVALAPGDGFRVAALAPDPASVSISDHAQVAGDRVARPGDTTDRPAPIR